MPVGFGRYASPERKDVQGSAPHAVNPDKAVEPIQNAIFAPS